MSIHFVFVEIIILSRLKANALWGFYVYGNVLAAGGNVYF